MKRSFGELDGYIRGRSFEAKRRIVKILVFGTHPAEFARMGLGSFSLLLDDTISGKGIRQTKAVYGKIGTLGLVRGGGGQKTSALRY